MHLQIKCLSKKAQELYENHESYYRSDSGFDLYIIEDQLIQKKIIGTKVHLGIKVSAFNNDTNTGWFLMPRSSISKTPLRLSNSIGLIDAGYRGEIIALLDNISDHDYQLKKGERIVQAVSCDLKSVTFELMDELDETERGNKGIGSTNYISH